MIVSRNDRTAIREWLRTHANDVMQNRREEAFESVYMLRQPTREVPENDREQLYDVALATIGNVPICYLEFGVFQGHSIRSISSRFSHPDARFIGFDSFEGLPEDWTLPWASPSRGTFSTEGMVPAISDPRVTFMRGWFQDSLPKFLAGFTNDKPLLVHFDADLYSSTLFLLSTLWASVNDYYFIFDEFIEHECIALHDFMVAFPTTVDLLCQSSSPQGYPNQILGRMQRVPYGDRLCPEIL